MDIILQNKQSRTVSEAPSHAWIGIAQQLSNTSWLEKRKVPPRPSPSNCGPAPAAPAAPAQHHLSLTEMQTS